MSLSHFPENVESRSEHIARAAIGVLLFLHDLAAIGVPADQLVEFADLCAVVAAEALGLVNTCSLCERLKDEAVALLADSPHTQTG